MNRFSYIVVLCIIFIGIFLATVINTPREWLGAQFEITPLIVAYVALRGSAGEAAFAAAFGGLFLDSLSMNPLGISILPLFLIAVVLQSSKEIMVVNSTYTQFIVGLCAGAASPVLTMFMMLLVDGPEPMLGWVTLWHLTRLSLPCGLLSPILFKTMDRLDGMLTYPSYPQISESMVSGNRQIKRGKH